MKYKITIFYDEFISLINIHSPCYRKYRIYNTVLKFTLFLLCGLSMYVRILNQFRYETKYLIFLIMFSLNHYPYAAKLRAPKTPQLHKNSLIRRKHLELSGELVVNCQKQDQHVSMVIEIHFS